MPRIADEILDCAIYLYPSAVEARAGEKAGGSGFLVCVLSQTVAGRGYVYAVTNSHVIREGRSPVIRLNTVDGDVDVLETGVNDWIHHPDGDDVAVCGIGVERHHKCRWTSKDGFISASIIDEYGIGPGDDTFLVGRLVNHDGKQRNLPSLRFGNIAMMPWEPIRHPTRGIAQECFIVECRSIGGYSGSPVFVHIPPLAHRPGRIRTHEGSMSAMRGHLGNLDFQGYGPWLLGVNGGHLPVSEPVRERDGTPVQDGCNVQSSSGMAWVVPAWRLAELLDSDELAEERRRLDEQLKQERDGQAT